MRKKTCGIPSIGNSRLSVYPVLAVIFLCLVFASGAWAQGTLLSGSLSTPILFDSNSYGITDYDSRPKVANPPGGLVSTAAWYDYGMELSWEVSQNSDNTYNYKYTFGPGWYPASNPKGDGTGTGPKPYVTNKNITAFDLQLGSSITSLSQLSNLKWDVYQFNGPIPTATDPQGLIGRVGTGDATGYQKCDPTNGAANTVVNTSLLSFGDLVGQTGYTDQITLEEHYIDNSLFPGLQWANPAPGGVFLFSTDVTLILSFTSVLAPGWGNFFANSSRTGSNNNNSDVVAYNSSDTGYDSSALGIPVNFNNSLAVPGGSDTTPPTATIGGPSSSVAQSGPVTYTVSYTDDNFFSISLSSADVMLNSTGTASGTVSASGTTGNTRTVTISNITGSGTLGISLKANTATDVAGISASSSASSPTFIVKEYNIEDALKALNITIGLITPDANDIALYDVAPFVSGKPAANGTINILDVLMILRRLVGSSIW